MENIVEQGMLYDFYGPLLTQHQQEVYEACVYEDLSLAEAAERFSISRQGVHDLLRRCDRILRGYEEQLGLIQRFKEHRESLEGMRSALLEAKGTDGRTELSKEESEQLVRTIDDLLDTL